ncbi:MAG TPA: hypothetical protein VGP80_13910 [Gemmatimonadales bacterium]|nr:hypothetical protein [Gemmatimonadales bacterium]
MNRKVGVLVVVLLATGVVIYRSGHHLLSGVFFAAGCVAVGFLLPPGGPDTSSTHGASDST